MPAAIPIAALAVTAYGAYQAHASQTAAGMRPAPTPVSPSTATSTASETEAANLRAQTAAGTILSNPNDNRRQIGTQPNSPMKSLLGQ